MCVILPSIRLRLMLIIIRDAACIDIQAPNGAYLIDSHKVALYAQALYVGQWLIDNQ